MNRQQKRNLKKQGIDVPNMPTYNLNWDDMVRIKEEAKQEAYDQAVTTAITLLLSIPVKVVVEKYEWSQEDVEAFCNDLLEEYEEFDSSDMTLEELQQYVFDNCGVKFQKN